VRKNNRSGLDVFADPSYDRRALILDCIESARAPSNERHSTRTKQRVNKRILHANRRPEPCRGVSGDIQDRLIALIDLLPDPSWAEAPEARAWMSIRVVSNGVTLPNKFCYFLRILSDAFSLHKKRRSSPVPSEYLQDARGVDRIRTIING
jgi:hypothetical protein